MVYNQAQLLAQKSPFIMKTSSRPSGKFLPTKMGETLNLCEMEAQDGLWTREDSL